MWKGNNFDSSTIINGWGIVILFTYSLVNLTVYFQKIEHSSFENAMGFAFAGFIFYDGLWVVIYIFNYLNFRKETIPENQFLNYLSIILATMLTSFGLWRYARAEKKLSRVFNTRASKH